MRINVWQTSFNAGELASTMFGRTDLKQWTTGLSHCLNMIPTVQGALIKRPGTQFIVAAQSQYSRLLPFVVSNDDNALLEIYPTGIKVYVNGTAVATIAASFTSTDIKDITFAQHKNELVLAHKNFFPKLLVRNSLSSWTLSDLPIDGVPLCSYTDTLYSGRGSGTTLSASGTSGSVTLTSSAALFASTDVNRTFRVRSSDSDAWTPGIITAYTNSTTVTATLYTSVTGTPLGTNWVLGAFSNTTKFPAAVALFDQRLVFGGTQYEPQRIDFSRSADLYNFIPDPLFDGAVDSVSAFFFNIYSNQTNEILWMLPQQNLIVGTNGGIFKVQSSSSQEAVSIQSINIEKINATAVIRSAPISYGSVTLFIDRSRKRPLEFTYNYADDAYKANNLAIMADHITTNGISVLCKQEYPNNLVWAITDTNDLVSMTYLQEASIAAWAKTELGGEGKVTSIASLPNLYEDDLYVIVKRTINSSVVYYIERLSPSYIDKDLSYMRFLDSYLLYTGSAVTTITGLSHLEGKDVVVYDLNGYKIPCSTVESGSTTLQHSTTACIVGLDYSSEIETLPMSLELSSGTTVGKSIRPHEALIRVYKSYGGKIGSTSDSLDVIPELSSGTVFGNPTVLKTGDYTYLLRSTFDLRPKIYIKHDLPVPFVLLGILQKSSGS